MVQQSGVRSMKNNKYLLSVLLVLTIAVSLVVLVLVRTFLPIVILPKFSLANILLVSLVALVINYYITGKDNDYISIAVAFVAFLLFVDYITRLCDQYTIPFATNAATAEMLIQGLARGDLDWREHVNANGGVFRL